jgi:histidyl-tRNA synthetase
LTGVTIDLNSVGTPEVRTIFREKLLAFLRPIKDTLCKDCQSRMERNPLRVLDCKNDQDKFMDAPSILDSLDEECETHFARVRECLDEMGIPYNLNSRLVRGLDYYTHTAFEYKAQGIGAIDTIGGGGRYNGLVAEVGGDDKPGVGLGIGLERTLLLLENQGIKPDNGNVADVYLVAMGERAEKALPAILHGLRTAGIAAERDYLGRKTKAQFKAAERSGARLSAVLGDDELDRGEISLRVTSNGQHLQSVKLDDLSIEIQNYRNIDEKGKNNS